jgi:hypothetical protein
LLSIAPKFHGSFAAHFVNGRLDFDLEITKDSLYDEFRILDVKQGFGDFLNIAWAR